MTKESVARVTRRGDLRANLSLVKIDPEQLKAHIARRWQEWGAVHASMPSPARSTELQEIWNDIGRLNGQLGDA